MKQAAMVEAHHGMPCEQTGYRFRRYRHKAALPEADLPRIADRMFAQIPDHCDPTWLASVKK
jgi:hypothetical protein